MTFSSVTLQAPFPIDNQVVSAALAGHSTHKSTPLPCQAENTYLGSISVRMQRTERAGKEKGSREVGEGEEDSERRGKTKGYEGHKLQQRISLSTEFLEKTMVSAIHVCSILFLPGTREISASCREWKTQSTPRGKKSALCSCAGLPGSPWGTGCDQRKGSWTSSVSRETGHHECEDHMVPAAGIPPASSSLPGPTLEGRGMGLRQCQDSKHFLQTTQQKTPFSIFVENCRIRPFSNICC